MAKNREKRRDKFGRARDENTVVQLFKKSQPIKKKFEAERTPPPILALTLKQAEYLGHLRTKEQVFVLGPAGTGKTWMAATYAADLYRSQSIKKIINGLRIALVGK